MNVLRVRLKQLRTSRWPGRLISQAELAAALKIKNTSISEWESSRTSAKLPTAARLFDIATFFAPQSPSRPTRLLADEELTEAERAERDRLHGELLALLEPVAGPAAAPQEPTVRHPWAFGDGAPVLILVGALDEDVRPPYAKGDNHNYMALSAYADQDALVELFGHVRAKNPRSNVRYELSRRLENDDLQAHLVLLGNLAWTSINTLVGNTELPVRTVRGDLPDGELLQNVDRSGAVVETYRPTFLGGDPAGPVVEDVGYFYRTPSRINSTRTLTICGGVFTRGVYGAVRCLSDESAGHNVGYVAERLAGSSTYGLLMRVPVSDHATGTPDLRDPDNRLFEHTD